MAVFGIQSVKGSDKRQVKQQEKLQAVQMKGEKELSQFQQGLQLDTWKKTNYGAQVEQLKEAGLSTGLIYGMGGGGGTTTGTAGTSSLTGATAQGGQQGSNAIQGLEAISQLGLMLAQKKNVEADTRKKEVETQNMGAEGIGGQNVVANTNLTIQKLNESIANTNNIEAKTILTNIQSKGQDLDNQLKGKTFENQVDIVEWTARRMYEDYQQANTKTHIDKETQQTTIDQMKQNLIGTLLRNTLTGAQITNTQTDTKVKESQIGVNNQAVNASIQSIMQGWDRIKQGDTAQINQMIMQDKNLDQQDKELAIKAVTNILSLGIAGWGTQIKQTESNYKYY